MTNKFNKEWLPHLSPDIISGIQGNYLDAYVVALEGWRRGLTLKWHTKDCDEFNDVEKWFVDQPGQLFSLHSEEKSHYFFRTRGDLVTSEAVKMGMDKEITKTMLREANVPVPEGRQFIRSHTKDEIINYINKLGYPVVIKPTDGSFGRGVFSDIQTEQEVHHALKYLYEVLKETNIIVEKYIPGKDYRIYVVDDKVVGAILREPPNVQGDGQSTIETLIQDKNESRHVNPRLSGCPIVINPEIINYIARDNYDLYSIPEKGEIVYLSDKGNVSIGGDPIDVLDDLSEDIKSTAIAALKAIPNLYHGAVDIISNDNKTGYVIELNPTAQIGGLLFPLSGSPRDIPKSIIDLYFPETINQTPYYKMYFDFFAALEPLEKNVASETTVNTISPNKLVSKELIFKGEIGDLALQQYLRKESVTWGINGSIKQKDSDSISLIVAAEEHVLMEFINTVLKRDLGIENIEISSYTKPIKTGLEIENITENMIERLNDKRQEITHLRKEQLTLNKQYTNMLQSTSWKITKPLRLTMGLFKRTER